MIIKPVLSNDMLWQQIIDYADDCTWSAGKNMANQMRNNEFTDWERVFIAIENDKIAGYCTLTKDDCIPNVTYTPYIGYVFVGEAYRGNRLSEKMISSAISYAKGLGFDRVYLVSDHVNLYEKYGFVKIDEKPAPWDINKIETIFMKLFI